MKENVCAHCVLENFCAANDWCLFDRDNPNCPNYCEGMKEYEKFLKDEGFIK